jgi:programmed cell death 8 (apoptosis-inducing factor)
MFQISRQAARATLRLSAQSSRGFSSQTLARSRTKLGWAVGAGLGLSVAALSLTSPTLFVNAQAGPAKEFNLVTTLKDGDNHHTIRKFKYVIFGAGTAGYAAVRAIKANDPTAEVLIIAAGEVKTSKEGTNKLCEELNTIYSSWRRHLTEALPSQYEGELGDLDITIMSGYEEGYKIHAEDNEILFGDGTVVKYERCLVATTGDIREFYMLKAAKNENKNHADDIMDRLNPLKNLGDFERLQDILDEFGSDKYIEDVVVVGGGFLGTETALALSGKPGITVTQVYAESGVLSRYLPSYLSDFITKELQGAGVATRSNEIATKVAMERHKHFDTGREHGSHLSNRVVLDTISHDHHSITADYAVFASTHVAPDIAMALGTGLEKCSANGGILVNSQFEAIDGLYAAGNAASYFDPKIGLRRRLQRYEHAIHSGEVAGYNMSHEQNHIYNYQPSFQSRMDRIGLQLDAVGAIGKGATITAFLSNANDMGAKPYRRGAVYYIDDNSKVVGVMLWNCPELLGDATKLLTENPPTASQNMSKFKTILQVGPEEHINLRAEAM